MDCFSSAGEERESIEKIHPVLTLCTLCGEQWNHLSIGPFRENSILYACQKHQGGRESSREEREDLFGGDRGAASHGVKGDVAMNERDQRVLQGSFDGLVGEGGERAVDADGGRRGRNWEDRKRERSRFIRDDAVEGIDGGL